MFENLIAFLEEELDENLRDDLAQAIATNHLELIEYYGKIVAQAEAAIALLRAQ